MVAIGTLYIQDDRHFDQHNRELMPMPEISDNECWRATGIGNDMKKKISN